MTRGPSPRVGAMSEDIVLEDLPYDELIVAAGASLRAGPGAPKPS